MQGGQVQQQWRRVTPANAVNDGRSEQANKPVSLVSGDWAKKGLAKTLLNELCVREHWKLPVYNCCSEGGPPHQKWFTFVVVLDVKGPKATKLECYGKQKTIKKVAADSAAEAAIWCLGHMGYFI